jgi:hypothetical protein
MTTTASVAAGTWTVDHAHTRAAFTARHFFGQTVHGTITVTAATIEVGEDGRPPAVPRDARPRLDQHRARPARRRPAWQTLPRRRRVPAAALARTRSDSECSMLQYLRS